MFHSHDARSWMSLRVLLVTAACWLGIADRTLPAAETDTLDPALTTQIESIRRAVADLTETFAERYPRSAEFLSRLEGIKKRGAAKLSRNDRESLQSDLDALAREALTANPMLRDQTLLVEVREQYWHNHGPMGTMFQTGDDHKFDCGGLKGWQGHGGRLITLRLDDKGRPTDVKTIVDLPEGVARDADVHFDGRKILFSMRRNRDDDYHLYEVNIDGTDLKQLTFGRMISDIDPLYLPDGRILFSSTRDPKYCQCNRHIQPNLFAMEADGANIQQISRNTLADFHGCLMPDGRVLYSRWEYVDRHFGPSLGLWTTNPDGTQHLLFLGNNNWTPGFIGDARVIPGTEQVVCIYGACHDLPWGAMVVADRTKGLDGHEPIVQMWPEDAIRRVLPNTFEIHVDMNRRRQIDTFQSMPVKYEDPWPLIDPDSIGTDKAPHGGKYFLVSKSIGRIGGRYGQRDGSVNMGVFLVDVFGNEVCVIELPGQRENCFNPMPILPRKRPPVIPSRVDLTKREGHFYVGDVYIGDGDEMKSVERGSIKYLRIIEAPPKRFFREGQNRGIDATQVAPMNFNLTNNKRILGDVPVEADGSAYFAVPADTFVYFQALDEKKMMVQSMRSGTMVRPGETAGCIGCHENRLLPPKQTSRLTQAMRRGPSRIEPWWNARSVEASPAFNYLTEVQPVFDRHCVRCHDYDGDPKARINLSADVGITYNNSYLGLLSQSNVRYVGPKDHLVALVHDGPPAVLPAYSWGSHRSTLLNYLKKEHYGVDLSREDFERVVTWIDLNGVYYGEYSSKYEARNPLTAEQFKELLDMLGFSRPWGIYDREYSDCNQISFTRPEQSPLLELFKTEKDRARALEIIRAGAKQLADLPREDQTGPSTELTWHEDIARQKRIDRNEREESQSRRAALSGERHYQFGE